MIIKKEQGKRYGFVYIPIYASGEFRFKIPENFQQMNMKERLEHFYASDIEPLGSLCHQCSKHLETDHQIDDDYLEKNFADIFEVPE